MNLNTFSFSKKTIILIRNKFKFCRLICISKIVYDIYSLIKFDVALSYNCFFLLVGNNVPVNFEDEFLAEKNNNAYCSNFESLK